MRADAPIELYEAIDNSEAIKFSAIILKQFASEEGVRVMALRRPVIVWSGNILKKPTEFFMTESAVQFLRDRGVLATWKGFVSHVTTIRRDQIPTDASVLANSSQGDERISE